MKETLNRQLNIGVAPSPLFPTRYTRGLRTRQPQLAFEDWSLDFYNDTRAIQNFHNMNGWNNTDGDRDLGSEMHTELDETYSNAGFGLLSYPSCFSAKCKYCKAKCQGQGLKWMKGGKQCHNACKATYIEGKEEAKGRVIKGSVQPPTPSGIGDIALESPPPKARLGTGATIGIVVGGLVVVGLIGYLATRKK